MELQKIMLQLIKIPILGYISYFVLVAVSWAVIEQ